MPHYLFFASDNWDRTWLSTPEAFVQNLPANQSVYLNNSEELVLLARLMDLPAPKWNVLDGAFISQFWDISAYQLPEFNKAQFEEFYENWMKESGRENTMDEYGSLIFMEGLTPEWNKRRFRWIGEEP